MNDLHDRFAAWIAAGARDDPPRDIGVHSSGCDDCLRQAAAFDALFAIDAGAAPMPPARVVRISTGTPRSVQLVRATSGAMVVVLVVAAGAIAGSTLFRPRATELPPVAAADPTPAGDVLSGVGTPSLTPAPTPHASESARPEQSASPRAARTPAAIAAATPLPFTGGGPPPMATAAPATPRPATPRPAATPAPSTAPTVAPLPSSTAVPTPSATVPAPSPDPTPTPSPSVPPTPQCSDGLDNDGDGGIDFGLDPLVNDLDCTSLDDDDESGLLP